MVQTKFSRLILVNFSWNFLIAQIYSKEKFLVPFVVGYSYMAYIYKTLRESRELCKKKILIFAWHVDSLKCCSQCTACIKTFHVPWSFFFLKHVIVLSCFVAFFLSHKMFCSYVRMYIPWYKAPSSSSSSSWNISRSITLRDRSGKWHRATNTWTN